MALNGLMWETVIWEFLCPLRWNQALPLKRMSLGHISAARISWRYQFAKLSLALLSLWSTFVLYVCKCSSFVAISADDRNMIICCTSRATYFPGNVSNWTLILSSFYLVHVFCRFCYCLEWTLLLSAFSHICRLLSCLEQFHQETFIWI